MLHEIRDPIHGFILFDDLEKDLINSLPYQRLRRIKQLAMTHFVYPGAVHTRFEHSLGVMEFATMIFDTLRLKQPSTFMAAFGLEKDADAEWARRVLRLAALLHDVGHAPFSHAPEELLAGGHERRSVQLIRETDIKEIIEDKHYRHGVRVDDIVPVVLSNGTTHELPDAMTQFQNIVITGVFGADRIDYLLRDSLHAGVRYGEFDAQRLIHTLTLVIDPETGDPRLALERGGAHSAGSLLLARYLMFQQVYYHRVRRVYDYHLLQALRELLPEGRFPGPTEEYLGWDDSHVESLIVEKALQDGSSDVVRRLLAREHFRLAGEAPEAQVEEYLSRQDDIEDALKSEIGAGNFYVDGLAKELATETELDFPIVQGGKVVSSWHDESPLFRTLPPLGFFRLYVGGGEEVVQQAAALWASVFGGGSVESR